MIKDHNGNFWDLSQSLLESLSIVEGDLIFPHFVGAKDERVAEKLDRCLCQIIDIVLVSQIVYIDYRSGTAFC